MLTGLECTLQLLILLLEVRHFSRRFYGFFLQHEETRRASRPRLVMERTASHAAIHLLVGSLQVLNVGVTLVQNPSQGASVALELGGEYGQALPVGLPSAVGLFLTCRFQLCQLMIEVVFHLLGCGDGPARCIISHTKRREHGSGSQLGHTSADRRQRAGHSTGAPLPAPGMHVCQRVTTSARGSADTTGGQRRGRVPQNRTQKSRQGSLSRHRG
mmetsp:Transcript_39086/g.70072  ORF Transcript_39086/g.70072 Transcript_39086/m.70072 type:complete len:215 (-) Transcript_39086:79-723(-)